VHGRGCGGLNGIVAASLGAVATSLGIFLVGALAVQIRSGLDLSLSGLGLAVSVYYLAAAAAMPVGRLTEILGGARTMRIAAVGAVICLALVAAVARNLWALAIILAVSGALDAAMQPATNPFLVRRIATGRRGLAFGVKQAAVPLASLLGGLAVPALGLTIGWRWGAGCSGPARHGCRRASRGQRMPSNQSNDHMTGVSWTRYYARSRRS
jgi:MFS family permease